MIDWLGQLDPNTQSALWIIVVGAMTNVACALVGCFLVLRRMSLLGDAISHAVLPGLVIAFLFSGSLQIGAMFLGALGAALATTLLTQAISRHGGVPADASMGVVFTSLFALGVVLVSRYGSGVHLDDCLLYGHLIGVDVYMFADTGIPRAFVTIGIVLLINLAVIVLLWKELKISAFDPALATTMGINASLMHYVLMILVALTSVASFEQVGSILVVAMLIAPGATAHLLTDRLSRVLWIAACVGLLSAVFGYLLADWLDTTIAGAMSVVAGGCYALAMIAAPRYGALSRLMHQGATSLRIVCEDVLAMLYRLEELEVTRRLGPREARSAVGGGWLGWMGCASLQFAGQVERLPEGLQLTEAGRRRAAGLVRSHRLWEAYLVEHLDLPADHVHDPAHRMEHYIDRGVQERLLADVTDTELDPHGRQIPE